MSKLLAEECCSGTVRLAAEIAGLPVELVNTSCAEVAKNNSLHMPMQLVTDSGNVNGWMSILRHIARKSNLYGEGAFNNSQVDDWLECVALLQDSVSLVA